uniref:Tau-tubulin kinase 2 n=1 Tax=Ascaris suum TaxID=6253 RepID=F1L7T7_ASCSU
MPEESPNGDVKTVCLQEGSSLCLWSVVKKLGEGGFGAVYLVKDSKGGEFALKAEAVDQTVKVLKMEVFVLRELKNRNAKHFCDIVDSGQFHNVNYIVMTLVGSSLQDLRKMSSKASADKEKLTLGCALSVGIQCLEAIHELHDVGYLHRDVKPANFAIDKLDTRKIYLLDLGLCRKYVGRHGEIRRPRWAAGFRGTIRYAALSCHVSREQCRKDDLESWLYQQVELTTGSLPWKCLEPDKKQVALCKERCRKIIPSDLFGGCPREYPTILSYIDSLSYYRRPDYDKITALMRSALNSNNVLEYPYDWEQSRAFI